MNTKLVITVLIALVIGFTGGHTLAASKSAKISEHMMENKDTGMHGSMDNMMAGLAGKTGDDFDKAFLSEMITHHQGAVEMAQAALKNAKHEEIKTMAKAIITAQTAEIQQMQNWQKSWYGQ